MSRQRSGLITNLVTLETLHLHHVNSHVKQRLLLVSANTSGSKYTTLRHISKHYSSISHPFLVIWSKLIGNLSLTLALARSGQFPLRKLPFCSDLAQISPRSNPDLPKKFPYNTSQTTQSTLKNTLPHSTTTPKNTPEHSVSGAGLC